MYIITINGCHFSDSMKYYKQKEMLDFLKKVEYKKINSDKFQTVYDFERPIGNRKTILFYNNNGDYVDMNLEE